MVRGSFARKCRVKKIHVNVRRILTTITWLDVYKFPQSTVFLPSQVGTITACVRVNVQLSMMMNRIYGMVSKLKSDFTYLDVKLGLELIP